MELPPDHIPLAQREGILSEAGSLPNPAFLGFAPPISNTTYTPNQFFDVCLPYSSRGCVRLVAYMLRRTLGWCDANGNPQEDQLVISYNDLVTHVGISRGAVADAIQEAIASNFIRCVRKGKSKAAGQSAVTALYELRWDSSPEYIKDPRRFGGFYEGEGNRTDIPNEFFDVLVRSESLATIKVVGAIIRFSIGFQAHRGARRQQTQLSFSAIQRYAKIAVRRHLSAAIQHALEKNYIVRLQQGLFTPNKEEQLSTTYAVKWVDKGPYPYIGSKKTPETEPAIGSKKTPEERFKKDTRIGSKRTPEERFKKDTSIKTKLKNETFKQQQAPAGHQAAAAEKRVLISQLQQQGIASSDAAGLVEQHSVESIHNQLAWLDQRQPTRNRAGMLRKAIEEQWPQPVSSSQSSDISAGKIFAAYFYAGYAGSTEEPTASPTLGDATEAQAYSQRLLKIWPDQDKLPEWGRLLGTAYAAKTATNAAALISCKVALRVCGDKLLKEVLAARQRLETEELKRAREEHKKAFATRYKAFLMEHEAQMKDEQPALYADFIAWRNEQRAQILRNPFCRDDAFRAEQLQRFDSDTKRLVHFAQFYQQHVPSFWTWDEQYNPNSFDKAKALV